MDKFQMKKSTIIAVVTSILIQSVPINILADEKKEETNIEMNEQEKNKQINEDSLNKEHETNIETNEQEENKQINENSLNKEDETKLEKDVKNDQDIPNFDITTNITDNPFKINDNFTMTFKMNSDATNNKTIKKGDKIKVQLPPDAINSFVFDVSDVPTLNPSFNKNTGEFIIEFTEDIVSTGNSSFRINFVVGDKKVHNYKINISFEREGNLIPLQISNNDNFNSLGEYISNYKFLSPYWNTGASNYIGQDEQDPYTGLFLSTTNIASFYLDVNSGFNYTDNRNGFEISIETIDNIELIEDSVKVIRYDGENDKIGTPVSKENLKWWPQLQEGVHRLGIKENYTGKRYRVFFDGLVQNIQAPFTVQFYSNEDTYYPFLKSKMTNKISNSNYIPNIFGPTYETIKVGSNFDPKEGMKVYDEEDKDITYKLQVTKNTVTPNIPGVYEVVYEVTDNDGNTTKLTKTVKVTNGNPPILIGIKDKTIKVGESFNPKEGVRARDPEDGPIPSSEINVIGNVDTSKVGVYQLIYEVKDSDGNITQKSCIVTVKDDKQISVTVPTKMAFQVVSNTNSDVPELVSGNYKIINNSEYKDINVYLESFTKSGGDFSITKGTPVSGNKQVEMNLNLNTNNTNDIQIYDNFNKSTPLGKLKYKRDNSTENTMNLKFTGGDKIETGKDENIAGKTFKNQFKFVFKFENVN